MTTQTHTTTAAHTARSAPKGPVAEGKTPDALALLKADHRTVEALFDDFEAARKPERKLAIVQSICDELTVHAELEEAEFYPLVRDALKRDENLVDEAEVEHASLKWLIAQLHKAQPDAAHYDARVTVLKEYVQHHVREEERTMFPKIRKSALDTAALGAVLQGAREKLQAKLKH